MATWQRKARLLIAVGAAAFAVVVAFAFRGRAPAPPETAVLPADPAALIQAAGAVMSRLNKDREEVRIHYAEAKSYPDGSVVMSRVKVITARTGGRTFTITAERANVGQNETTYDLTGAVEVTATDGMVLKSDRATYSEHDGIVRVPGAVTFARGRMSGTGTGLVYDKNRDLLQVLSDVVVRTLPDEAGQGALEIAAPTAELNRTENVMRFPAGMTAVRGGETVSADVATAFLSPEEDLLRSVELRGKSRITGPPGAAGRLESLTGRDINLRYGPTGQTIEQALIIGDAVMQLAGESRRPGGRISANTMDVTLAADGATPVGLAARDNVELTFPPAADGASRTVRARTLDGSGQAGRGLTRAAFAGDVQFYDRGQGVDRSARSQRLEVALAPGLATIEDAVFTRGVRFGEKDLLATAAAARYSVGKGTLALSGSEPGSEVPRVVNDALEVNAKAIDITLTGPVLKASGTVESRLKPRPKAQARKNERRVPSMLKEDQAVIVTADDLLYDGPASRATYTGSAHLVQADTSIRSSSLVVDDASGDLTGGGQVTTTVTLEQADDKQQSRRVRNTATSQDFKYEERLRRATYTGSAHVVGPQGDMTAARIELYFKPSGEELEFVEAYEDVTILDKTRKTTGSHMKYFSADERYEVTGSPVTIIDECGRQSTGRTLTLFRNTDRVILNGEQMRTQTRGASTCS